MCYRSLNIVFMRFHCCLQSVHVKAIILPVNLKFQLASIFNWYLEMSPQQHGFPLH